MEKHQYKTISVIGDSIANGYFDLGMMGWVARTIQKLQADENYGIYARNFAVSGDRIIDCLHRFRSQVVSNPGDCLVIACGSNDIARWGTRESERSLSEAVRLETWDKLLTEARRIFTKIYILQIMPVDESRIPIRQNIFGQNQYYRNDDIASYNELLKEIATRFDCQYVSFDDLLASVHWPDHLFDDIHPNEKGHELVATRMYDILKKDLLESVAS